MNVKKIASDRISEGGTLIEHVEFSMGAMQAAAYMNDIDFITKELNVLEEVINHIKLNGKS